MEYYFASKNNFDKQILEPRIPVNRMNSENDTTKRVCVSQSINGCLTAVGMFNIGDTVYVHKCKSDNVIQPFIEQVQDSCFTGELWILEPVEMELFITLVIIGLIDATINNIDNILYAFKLTQ